MNARPHDHAASRSRMVEQQLQRRGIRGAALLEAMRSVPRERFVAAELSSSAYADRPLPIAQGQTISQPYIVAAMIEAAEVRGGDTVLEVGCGSGYAAAVLSRIAHRVCALERHPALVAAARDTLAALAYDNVDVRVGDGTLGWPEPLRFDAIVVSAAGPQVPASLKAQLAVGGRLVMPVGPRQVQQLIKLTRRSEHGFEQHDIAAVSFVPLVGGEGWADEFTGD